MNSVLEKIKEDEMKELVEWAKTYDRLIVISTIQRKFRMLWSDSQKLFYRAIDTGVLIVDKNNGYAAKLNKDLF